MAEIVDYTSDIDEDFLRSPRNIQNTVNVRTIKVSVLRGQLFTKSPDDPESVTLTPTPSHVLYSQKPRIFSVDSNDAVIVKRKNGEYDINCQRYEDISTVTEAGTQTISVTTKGKITATAATDHADAVVDANYTDIYNAYRDIGDEDPAELKQTAHQLGTTEREDFGPASGAKKEDAPSTGRLSDAGTAYTATEDGLSDAGTAYTTGTANTTGTGTQSVPSTTSLTDNREEQQDEKARLRKLAATTEKLFADPGFKSSILLAELLALQYPLFPWVSLYRGNDIVYDPTVNYQGHLRSEFIIERNYRDEDSDSQDGSDSLAPEGREPARAQAQEHSQERAQTQDPSAKNAAPKLGVSPKIKAKHLFTYKSPLLVNLQAICCEFSPVDERLLIVGYAGQSLAEKYGALVLWAPENPFHPLQTLYTRSEVMAVSWFPQGKSIVAAGFADGSVSLYDLRQEFIALDAAGFVQPILTSSNKTGKHTSKVWDIQWVAGDSGAITAGGQAGQQGRPGQQDDRDRELDDDNDNEAGADTVEYDILISVAADGRVVERSIKRSFEFRDILTLTAISDHPVATRSDERARPATRMTIIRKLASALSTCFLPDAATYLVSSDDGLIRRASRAYSEQTLMTYHGHLSSVYRVRVNETAPEYFLSCSADRTCRVWSLEQNTPLITLRTQSDDHVYTACWSPYKSTVIITGTRAGTVEIWDFSETSMSPIITLPPLIVKTEGATHEDKEQTSTPTSDLSDSSEERAPNPEDILGNVTTVPVRCVTCNKTTPVFAVCYESGEVAVYRTFGLEEGVILRRISQPEFENIETQRISSVVEHQQSEEAM